MSRDDPEEKRLRAREYYAANREAILERKRQYREANLARVAERERRYREANRDAINERRNRHNEANRDAVRAQNRRNREANRDAELERHRQFHQVLRSQVFDHYGRSCACCGSSKDLEIDHVNGDGRQHREELFNNARAGGTRMYLWLVANSFPDGFQALCRPCNTSKASGERCRLDHQTGTAA